MSDPTSRNRVAREDGVSDPEGDFVFLDIFRDESAHQMLLSPMPANKQHRPSKMPSGLPAYLSHLWAVPLLTAEQERHEFRKLNFLKYRASCAKSSLRSSVGGVAMTDDLEWLDQRITEVRNQLIEANLRLVISLAKRFSRWNTNEFDEAVCVGNAALIRAVDLFDFRRGVRFSTYAYKAIQTSIFSTYRTEGRIKSRFVSGGSDAVESAIDDVGESGIAELQSAEIREQVIQLMQSLDPRDRKIVMARFGINRKQQGAAFHVIAKEIGLSTTRTSQLFYRSLARLRACLIGSKCALES